MNPNMIPNAMIINGTMIVLIQNPFDLTSVRNSFFIIRFNCFIVDINDV